MPYHHKNNRLLILRYKSYKICNETTYASLIILKHLSDEFDEWFSLVRFG